MEKTQKRRSSGGGFMRSLFKAAVKKPSSCARCETNKVNPSPSNDNNFASNFGLQKTTTTFSKPNNNINNNVLPNYFYYYEATSYGVNTQRDNFSNNNNNNYYYNYNNGGDENVDVKAASYISNVRERFKLDKADSDQRMY